MKTTSPLNLKALRHQLGLSQYLFWKNLGVTQSTGCRYENGRDIPLPVLQLLTLTYIEQLPIHKLNKTDTDIALMLRQHYLPLYESLKKDYHASITPIPAEVRDDSTAKPTNSTTQPA